VLSLDRLTALAAEWRAEADRMRRYADERGATICELHARELDVALREWLCEALKMDVAGDEIGCTEEAMRKRVQRHQYRNVGRPGEPRVRRGDLLGGTDLLASPDGGGVGEILDRVLDRERR
jgi:hypothetical protein